MSLFFTDVSTGYRRGLRRRAVLDHLDLEVRGGEVTALVGPNGAGKTTLLRTAAGRLRPWCGRVERDRSSAGRVAFLPDGVEPPRGSTLARFLRYGAFLAGLAHDRAEAAIVAAARDVMLQEHLLQPITTFSRGMKRRAAIAFVLLERPSVVLLDEPWAGLDPESRQLLRAVLRGEADRGTLVLASSHETDQVARIADRVLLLERGRIVGDLRGGLAPDRLERLATALAP